MKQENIPVSAGVENCCAAEQNDTTVMLQIMEPVSRLGTGSWEQQPSSHRLRNTARGRWIDILQSLGVKPSFLTGKHGPCPFCGGKDRFRLSNKDDEGFFYCNQCGSGDGFKFIQRLLCCNFGDACTAVERGLNSMALASAPASTPSHIDATETNLRNSAALLALFRDCQPVKAGDPVWQYWSLRGLGASIPSDLSLHPALDYWELDDNGEPIKLGTFPTMVAPVISPAGHVVSALRTYLTHSGAKALVAKPKKLMASISPGATKSGAIRLLSAGDTLAVAEGIETAFAYHLLSGIPAWATVSATGLRSVILPESIRTVYICIDLDENGCGEQAAKVLAQRLLREERRVKFAKPPAGNARGSGFDWADYLALERRTS
jgi:putative DNA primase/helicase